MTLRKPFLAICATAFALCTPLPAAADHDAVKVGGLTIEQAYGRVTAQSGAVYMVIENHSDADDRLLAASAPEVAEMATLHGHLEDANGVMQMPEATGGFVIPVGGQHALARSGDHIMLMGLSQDLKTGDMMRVTLTFENAGEVTIDVPVDNERSATE